MTKKKDTILILLSLLAFVVSQKTTLEHINQLNEHRFVDLYNSFGIATDLFTANSVGDSPSPILTQPLETFLNQANPLSSQYILASSEIEISATITSSAQIVLDDNDNPTLSLLSIDSSTPQVQITQIASQSLSQYMEKGDFRIEVSLYAKNSGLILLSFYSYSKIVQFTMNGDNIAFSSIQHLLPPYSQFLQAVKNNDNTIYFFVTNKQPIYFNYVYLYSISNDGSNIKEIERFQGCTGNQAERKIMDSFVYGFQCNYRTGVNNVFTYNFVFYRMNPITNSVETLESPYFGFYQKPDLFNSKIINNQIYALQYFRQTDRIIVIKASLNFSDQTVSSQQSTISANSDQRAIGIFIMNDQLITLISGSLTYGYSINKNVKVLQFITPITGYTVIQPYSYANSLLLNLKSNSNETYASLQVFINVPRLTYIQSTNSGQSYVVTMNNNPINKQLQIFSRIGTFNEYSLQIMSSVFINYLIGSAIFSIDNNFSGSNINPTVGQVSPVNTNLQPSIRMIQNLIPDVDLLSTLFVSNIAQIFNVNQQQLLIDYFDIANQSRQAYLFEISNQIVILAQIPINQSLSIVDQAGFFLTSVNNYWTIVGFVKEASSFQTVTTTCQSTSTIQFSSLPSQSTIAVICDNTSLSLYIYTYNNGLKVIQKSLDISSVHQTGNVLSVSLRSTGLLYIASSTMIVCVEINALIIKGYITIPQAYQSNQIYLFQDSFFLATNSINVISIVQLSYNNFNNGNAVYLRQLMNFDYSWLISENTFSGINQVINFSQNGSEEYLVIDAVNTQSQLPFKMFYKTSQITSENQFYTAIPTSDSQYFFALPGQFGYYSITLKKFLFFNLSYTINLSLNINYSVANPITSTFTFPIVLNSNYSLNYEVTLQRSLSTYDGIINTENENVQKLSNYFMNNQLTIGSTIKFDDTNFFTSNNYGWQIPDYGNNISLNANINQKIALSSQISTSGYVDILEIMPNSLMYTKLTQTFLDGQQISGNNSGRCTLYRDDAQTQVNLQETEQTIQVTIYQSCLDISVINLTQYQITGVYSSYPESVPNVSITNTASYSISQNILTKMNLIRIITDPLLSMTLAILQQKDSITSLICELNFSLNPATLDCDTLSLINNQQIVNVYWLSSQRKVIYISIDGNGYYNFDATNNNITSIPIKISLISQNKNLVFGSEIMMAKDIGNNHIIVAFNSKSFFILSIEVNSTDNTLFISNPLVFYSDKYLDFTNNVYYSINQSQVVLLSRSTIQNNQYYFAIYEQIQNTSDYLMTSSTPITLNDLQDVRFYIQENKLFALCRPSIQLQLTQPLIITLKNYVEMVVTNFNTTMSINGFGSSISPINANFEQRIGFIISQKGIPKFAIQLTFPITILIVLILSLL